MGSCSQYCLYDRIITHRYQLQNWLLRQKQYIYLLLKTPKRCRVKVIRLKCKEQATVKFQELPYLMSVWILFMVVDLCEPGIGRNNNQSIKCTSTSSFKHRGREFLSWWLSSRSKQFHSNVRSRNIDTYVDVFKVRTKIRPRVCESWKQKIFTIGWCVLMCCITVSFNVIVKVMCLFDDKLNVKR